MTDESSSISRLRIVNLVAGLVLWIAAGGMLYYFWQQRQSADQELADDVPPVPVARKVFDPNTNPPPEVLPEFELQDSRGEVFSSKQLTGRPTVVGFVFTRCAATCPMITARMKRLQEEFPAQQLQLLTITVDPRHDSSQILHDYATSYEVDFERWKFLTGEPEEIFQLINRGFGLVAVELFGEDRKPGLEVEHTNRVVLVGPEGRIEGTYLANDEAHMVRLRKQIEKLNQSTPPADASSESTPVSEPNSDVTNESDATDEDENSRDEASPDEADSVDEGQGVGVSNPPFDGVELAMVDGDESDLVEIEVISAEPGVTIERLPTSEQKRMLRRPGLPDFELLERSGETVNLDQLRGKQWVASFMFTRCAGPCPRVMGAIRQLQDRLEQQVRPEAEFWPVVLLNSATPMLALAAAVETSDQIALDRYPTFDGDRVQLVTFTVDPENDRPEVLRRYADALGADRRQWWFLTGEKSDVYGLIQRGFGQLVQELFGADRRPGYEVVHTTNVVHVDAVGRIRGSYDATDQADLVSLQRALISGRIEKQRDPVAQVAIPRAASQLISTAVENEQTPAAVPAGSTSTGEVESGETVPAWVESLPAVNAGLNSVATLLLIGGFVLIRRGQRTAHRNVMLAAFAVSVLFLSTYLLYHFSLQHYTGEASRKFSGSGGIRTVYFIILISHILLAAVVPVLAIWAIRLGLKGRFEAHRRIARVTYPVWVYVSVTGVIIYGMLYHWPAAA